MTALNTRRYGRFRPPVTDAQRHAVGQYVRQLRTAHHLTPAAAAERASLPVQQLRAIETGDVDLVDHQSLGRLAKTFGVDIVDIYQRFLPPNHSRTRSQL